MNRTERFAAGQYITAGEKALVVMLAAGLFGYWAGFNLSSPAVAVGMPAVVPATVEAPAIETVSAASAAPLTPDEHPWLVNQEPKGAVVRDDPPIATF
jgi:hypothetical protein